MRTPAVALAVAVLALALLPAGGCRRQRPRLVWSYLKSWAWFERPAAETLPPTV